MKFTSEDLMKAMGLQVDDEVKYNGDIYRLMHEEKHNIYVFVLLRDKSVCFAPTYLIDQDFEILPRPKRVGDLKCAVEQKLCGQCPTRIICTHHACKELGAGNTLYEYLETYKTNIFEDDEDEYVYDFDQEIYDLLKARLDKEVGEC